MAWSEVGTLKEEFYPRFALIDIPILATALTIGGAYRRDINGWGRATLSLYGTDDGGTKVGIVFFVTMVNRSSAARNIDQNVIFYPSNEMLPAETIPVYKMGINVLINQSSLLFTCDQTCAYIFGNGSTTSPVLIAEGNDIGVAVSFKGTQEDSAIGGCDIGTSHYFRAPQSATLEAGSTIVLCGRMSAPATLTRIFEFI